MMSKNRVIFHVKRLVQQRNLLVHILHGFFILTSGTAQSTLSNASASNETNLSPEVEFIEAAPIIDGILDAGLEYLKEQSFKYIWQFDNPVTDTAKVSYRMAYTPSHLYLYIETNIDSVSYHRRGYLWGDGYKVLLGIPQKGTLTDEYYELAYSPSLDKNHWERQKIFGYNFTQIRKYLSNASLSQEKATGGKSGFEALIAWDDIKPYHPWFLDELGYNIYFAKGIESKDHGYITNGYSLVEDEGIWDEEIPKRNYKSISFKNPNSVKKQVILAKPPKCNIQVGKSLEIEIATIDNEKSSLNLGITFSDESARIMKSKLVSVHLDKVLTKQKVRLDIRNLRPGKYNLTIQNGKDTIANDGIMIQPTINFNKIEQELSSNRNHLEIGTKNTLQFELSQLASKLEDLKDYETGEEILAKWKLFQKKYALFLEGRDPYEPLSGPYRRAFKSKYDDTYQPYTIKLPTNYDQNKKYPLLVFLHGSGSDEQSQGLLDKPRSGGNFIEIAPLARDIFRAYSSDESQKDIIEAIDDVCKYFAVDTSSIIIGGFSMGGYGAPRTFYEHPELYKGIAIFAGHPNLANEWLEGDYPNFLDEKYLASFSDIPVFIYHGRKDPALDVGLIEEMSKKLSKAGANVTISIVEENAHEYPDDKTNKMYFEWLNSTIKK